MKNFFSHDEGARNDPKLIKVLMRLGQVGKSTYWDLIEMLYEQNGYLVLSECESYAFALRTSCELIESLIHDFDLFENDGTSFWSESALRRLAQRKAKSVKAAESTAKRWGNTNAMRTHSGSNAKKEKEKKRKEIDSSLRSESPPTPEAGTQKEIGGSAAEDSDLLAQTEKVSPVAAAPSDEPAWHDEAKELAAGMYGLWGITHLQADAQMRVLRFVKAQFAAGKAALLTAQFVAYRDFKKASEQPLHSWKTYIGSNGYADGAWNTQDWTANLTTYLKTTPSHGSSHRRNNGPAAAAGRVSALTAEDYTRRPDRSTAA